MLNNLNRARVAVCALVAFASLAAVTLYMASDAAASGGSPSVASTTTVTNAAVTPQQAPQPAEDMLALQDAMTSAIEQYWVPGKYAVAVTDLQTGETVSVNGDQARLSGCSRESLRLVPGGPRCLVRPLPTGIRRCPHQCHDLEQQCHHRPASCTASSAVAMSSRVSGECTTSSTKSSALDAVVLDHPPAYGDSIGVSPDNWVTAVAMNRALAALWHGEVVPEPSWRDYLLHHMTVVKPGLNYLTAAVPEVVSHKNGFLWASTGYVDNDAGIVRFQRGGTEYAYAISFFSEEVTEEYADIPLGQQLGNLAYEVMTARYPY